MTQGFQTFNSDGSVDVDVTSSLPKYLGSFTIDGSAQSGSVYNADLQEGRLWYLFVAANITDTSYASVTSWVKPTVWKDGNYVKWSFDTNKKVTGTVQYGVY